MNELTSLASVFHQVKSKLKGHQKRITGLAFSTALNILVSSGADAQVRYALRLVVAEKNCWNISCLSLAQFSTRRRLTLVVVFS